MKRTNALQLVVHFSGFRSIDKTFYKDMNVKFSKNTNIIVTETPIFSLLYYVDRPEANRKNWKCYQINVHTVPELLINGNYF